MKLRAFKAAARLTCGDQSFADLPSQLYRKANFCQHLKIPIVCRLTILVACLASVFVWFGSKERPRNGILGFGRARNETRAKKWKWGEGKGKEGNACRQTPRFWKPAFASERSAWLARLVEQCWHVSIKGLFHTERTVWYVTRILIFSGCCLFWSARFAKEFSLTSFET